MQLSDIENDAQVFAEEGQVAIGAVRRVMPGSIEIYIENYGQTTLTQDQILAIHDGKVVLAIDKLSNELRTAIVHAHDRELSDLAGRGKNDPPVS
ncbi:hypothetical protein [Sulfitobacter sp. SK012]|uniref:hypothetical protein n=1 Tax=Sulfitobacter sp. SK012 TaxID=1389005 RepID=UPI0013B43A88|nr:hypothetical protein [Sulfitobacter sp. SK012]